MPVRSLNSSVIKWPDLQMVDRVARDWVAQQVSRHAGVVRAGYFGSYARGDWGPGSDLDLILIVENSERSLWERPLQWDTLDLLLPVDLLVYTQDEWSAMTAAAERTRPDNSLTDAEKVVLEMFREHGPGYDALHRTLEGLGPPAGVNPKIISRYSRQLFSQA